MDLEMKEVLLIYMVVYYLRKQINVTLINWF